MTPVGSNKQILDQVFCNYSGADPDTISRGASTQREEANPIFCQFFKKIHEIEKCLVQRQNSSGVPLRLGDLNLQNSDNSILVPEEKKKLTDQVES